MTTLLTPDLASLIDVPLPESEDMLQQLKVESNDKALVDHFYPTLIELLSGRTLSINKVVAIISLAKLEYEIHYPPYASGVHVIDIKKYVILLIPGSFAQEHAMLFLPTTETTPV
jgi:hypothetical protein